MWTKHADEACGACQINRIPSPSSAGRTAKSFDGLVSAAQPGMSLSGSGHGFQRRPLGRRDVRKIRGQVTIEQVEVVTGFAAALFRQWNGDRLVAAAVAHPQGIAGGLDA